MTEKKYTESAILATYRITMTHLNIPHQVEYTKNVQIYHPNIWKKINPNKKTEPPQALVVQPPLPLVGRINPQYEYKDHPTFVKDAQVVVVDTFKVLYHCKFKGMSGRVVFAVKPDKWFIGVYLDDKSAREEVKILNQQSRNKISFDFLKEDQLDVLCCKVGQIKLAALQHTPAKPNVQKDKTNQNKNVKSDQQDKESTPLGKRKASAHPSDK